MVTIIVNGVRREIQAPDDTPLLYVLRNDLELSGPQFGCGLAQCGACSVLLDGKEIRSCITPVSARGRQGSHDARRPARAGGRSRRACRRPTPRRRCTRFKQAWIEEQTPLCGFCQNGMMIKATELLESIATPTVARNQRGLHHVGSVGASVPLRKLHRHHRSRAARRHGHGEREVSDGHSERKIGQRFWRHADAP